MANFVYHSLPNKPCPPGPAVQDHQEVIPADGKLHRLREKISSTSLSSRAAWTFFTAIISFITASLIVYGLTTSTPTNPPSHARVGQEECGLSPSEARKNNCVFDPIIMGWVPGRCYDADLARDFLSRRNWTFHRTPPDGNGKTDDVVVEMSDVLAGDWDFLYVEPQFYILQCLYTWKKTWRAAVENAAVVVDGYLADEHHTNHCEMLITKGPEREKSLYMKYSSCPWGKHGSAGRFGWYRVVKGKRVYRLDA